jgi:TniQ
MPLPVPVIFHSDETPESYADRLSAANSFPTNRTFFTMTAIDHKALVRGDATPLAKLASWSGEDVAKLATFGATTKSRKLNWTLGCATFSKEARRGNRFRYCPNCVVDDWATGSGRPVSRPYVRAVWTTRSVKNCTRHARPLIEAPFTSNTESSFCRFATANRAIIETQSGEPASVLHMSLDAYIEKRISGFLSEPYLDQFDACIAIDFCTHLGRFLKRHRPALSLLPQDLRSATSREIGLHIARQGEAKIRSTATWIIERRRPKGQEKFLFGSLGRWLRSNSGDPDFAQIIELFQDVAERNLPYAPGEMCFIPVRRRYLHSVTSAGVEYGLFEARIVELLKDAGLIGDASLSPARIYFDADKAHAILDAARRTITSEQARTALGVTAELMSRILAAGFVPRVEMRRERRNYSRIRLEDLEEFQRRIFANVAVGDVEKDWVTIDYLCQKAACEKADILASILDGRLARIGAPASHGFKLDALRFELSAALQHFSSSRKTVSEIAKVEAMSQQEASAYMHVKPTTIPYLIERGLLDTETINNPVNKRLQTVVTVASMDAFMAEHVAVSQVAATYETHPNVILDIFEKMDINPIYDNCGNVSRFFRRSEIVDATIVLPRARRK